MPSLVQEVPTTVLVHLNVCGVHKTGICRFPTPGEVWLKTSCPFLTWLWPTKNLLGGDKKSSGKKKTSLKIPACFKYHDADPRGLHSFSVTMVASTYADSISGICPTQLLPLQREDTTSSVCGAGWQVTEYFTFSLYTAVSSLCVFPGSSFSPTYFWFSPQSFHSRAALPPLLWFSCVQQR